MATSLDYERWRDAMDTNMHHARFQSFQNQQARQYYNPQQQASALYVQQRQAMAGMGSIGGLSGALVPGSFYDQASQPLPGSYEAPMRNTLDSLIIGQPSNGKEKTIKEELQAETDEWLKDDL